MKRRRLIAKWWIKWDALVWKPCRRAADASLVAGLAKISGCLSTAKQKIRDLAFGFQIKPQMGLQLDGFGRFGQHDKAVGFGFGVGEYGRVVGKRFVH